jgi:hypothetical protein
MRTTAEQISDLYDGYGGKLYREVTQTVSVSEDCYLKGGKSKLNPDTSETWGFADGSSIIIAASGWWEVVR